ncbi:hypothetical protein WJX77_001077 [Trebouxia sp. C0004]
MAPGAQGYADMESTTAYWCKETRYVRHLLVLMDEAQVVLQVPGREDLKSLNGVSSQLRRILHARVTQLTLRAPAHCLHLVRGKRFYLTTLTYKPGLQYLHHGEPNEGLTAELYPNCKVCRNAWVNILVFWARGFSFLKEWHLSGVPLEAAPLADIAQLG